MPSCGRGFDNFSAEGAVSFRRTMKTNRIQIYDYFFIFAPMNFIWKVITRLRHRRGYGIHSPLAFELVREALWPRAASGRNAYAFYDELRLPEASRSQQRRGLRLYHILRRHGIALAIESDMGLSDLRTLLPPDTFIRTDSISPSDYLARPGVALWKRVSEPERDNPDLIPGDLVLLLGDSAICISLPGGCRNMYDFR